ncbi:MAG TPA: HDOD domain-containing protein [Verrucomicrobiae bacterium]|nr:HDOD domain-containing protein [Verrucomicrobiae bacterium]
MQDISLSIETDQLSRIDSYIAKADHLPPAPTVQTQLLKLLGDPNADGAEIANILAYDPSLTANVLKVTNSAHFAGREPVQDIHQAVMRLGYTQIYQMVAFVCWAQSMAQPGKEGAPDTRLWKHSVTAALAAETMAKSADARSAVAFTTGLLHDIGKVVLTDVLGADYARVVEELDLQQPYPLETEKRLIGVEHCEVGGRLLARWGLPVPIIAAVWNHHSPASAKPHEALASLVCWGDIIAFDIEKRLPEREVAIEKCSRQPGMIAMSSEQLERYTGLVLEQMNTVKSILDLNG